MKKLCRLTLWLPLLATGAYAVEPLVYEANWRGAIITLHSANAGSINAVRFFAQLSDQILLDTEVSVEGVVNDVEVADLDDNGFPEVYAFVTAAGSGSYGSVIAFASNRNLSMTAIHQMGLPPDSPALVGYRGHDRFRVLGRLVERRFPVYLPGDTNANPTGGIRRLAYELQAGEAGWLLTPQF